MAHCYGSLITLCLSSTFAQSTKLNLPLPLNPAIGRGIQDFELAPDDSRVVYLARESSEARAELHSRALDGSPAVRLTGAIPAIEKVLGAFQISPDSKRVVFLTAEILEGEYASEHRLYRAPLDGRSVPKRLADVGPQRPLFALSPDGAWVVYQVQVAGEYRMELFSVPIDGQRDPIRLASMGLSGSRVFRVADGRVIFVAAAADGAGEELISMTLEGTDRVVLGGTPLAQRRVPDFVIAPDGARVVYLADQGAFRVFELFSVPIGGGVATRLNGNLVQDGDVQDFDLSPDSTRVVYRANQEVSSRPELYVAPIDGASPVVKVSGNRAGSGVSAGARFSLDSARIVFRSDGLRPLVSQLFSAPADASALPVLVSGPSVLGGNVQATFQGSRQHLFLGARNTVVYLADAERNEVVELFAAPLDGSTPPRKLSGELVPSGDVLEFELSDDGSHVLFRADKEVDKLCDLFALPVAGGTPEKVNRVRRAFDLPFSFRTSSNGEQVLYAGEEGTPNVGELYQRPANASAPPVVVNGVLSSGDAQGDVHWFGEDPGGGRVLYAADQFVDGRDALISVRVGGAGEHLELSDEEANINSLSSIRSSHGRVIYLQPRGPDWALFSVPADGALAPVNLTPTLTRPYFLPNLRFSPDGGRVLFLAGELFGRPFELYCAAVDGSTPPMKLSGTLVQHGNVEEAIGLLPDGSRALYLADAERDGVTELYSVAADGSSAPVKLSGAMVEGGEVVVGHTTDAPLVTPDGRLVVFRADARVDERFELFAAPPDAATPPVPISGTLVPDGDVQAGFALALGGTRVVYRADALADEHFELFLAPLDGGAPARIDVGLAPAGDVLDFVVAPDGARLVVRADGDGDALAELYSVSLPGGRVRRLDAAAEPAGVLEFQIDPGSRRVVYLADPVLAGGVALFSVPLDGSGSPVRLDFALHKECDVQIFQIAPDEKKVVYLADANRDEVFELFCAPIDGSRRAVRRNDPLPVGGQVRYFQVSADSRRAFYLADQEQDNVLELFEVFLELPSRTSRTR